MAGPANDPPDRETEVMVIGVTRGPGTDLSAIFDAFGWNVAEVDGHDHVQIQQAYVTAGRRPHDGPPTVLLARTVKGKGISFTEDSYQWHAQIPSAAELSQAGAELGFGTEQ